MAGKAVLVIDMPKSCTDCPYCGFEQFTHNPACVICDGSFGKDEEIENNRSVICPLSPLPDKKPVSYHDDLYGDVEKNYTNIGWNDCLEELEK